MLEGTNSDDLSPAPEDPDVLSPSPSSADSFVTAYPSTGDLAMHASRQNTSFIAVQGKSTSVDHLINVGPEDPSVLSHPNQGNLGLAFNPPGNMTSERGRPLLGRTRPPSIDFAGEGSVDSDFERSDPNERYRHASLKNPSRPNIRGGELSLPSRALPSRTPTLSSISSTSSTASRSASSGTTERPQQPLPSAESSVSRPLESATLGRIQSGSSMFMNSRRDRSLDKLSSSASTSPHTLIVVGTTGCGKSTVIRHGIRGRLQGTFTRCSYWDGEVSYEGSALSIRAIEINVSSAPVDPDWLDNSTIDGVLICYDTSHKVSFNAVEGLLRYYHGLKLPTVVLACKADTQPEVDIYEAIRIAGQYGSELLPVTKSDEDGLWKAFTWFRPFIGRNEWDKGTYHIQGYECPNPASASASTLYNHQSHDSSRTTPKISSVEGNDQEETKTTRTTPSPGYQSFMTPSAFSRSGGISNEYEESAVTPRGSTPPASSRLSIPKKVGYDTIQVPDIGKDEADTYIPKEIKVKEIKEKESNARPGQWATLDDLLNKLLFLAVSGDDPSYITHFLLTYRRFASPRSVVLKMQSRIRELDEKSSGDPMFACFAQMRICHLLEIWIRDYPYDFAVRGTASALSALITTIISKTHLLHYGSELLPFLETLPTLVDYDAAWAVKIDAADEIDDPYEDEEVHPSMDDSTSPSPTQEQPDPIPSLAARERKSSFPLPSRLAIGLKQPDLDLSEKQLIKDLLKVSQEIQALEPEEIAQEITRIEVKLFLDIKPRHWLAYTFVSGKKDGKDPISALNAVSNHLADWVVSLILCHKTPRARVKQIEKLVEIAQRLRALNNYSALRAFVAGINNATFPGDETMEQFKTKSPDQAKNLQSWDVLLQHIRAHRAYRLALRNSKGACIPALEVHMSDLIKAHEGNGDFNSSDATKIHWGKFNMMGKFISNTAQCQAQCRTAADYNFTERSHIRELLLKPVMTLQMQKSRIAPIDIEIDDYRSTHPGSVPPRDVAILRKLIFW